MKTLYKILTITLAFVILVGCAGALIACNRSSSDEFTFWIPSSDGSSYYTDYADNPVARYLTEAREWNGTKLSIKWQVPPAGEETDNIALALSTGTYADVIDATSITNVMSINQLYAEDYILDLTEYVEKYMPNYKKFLEDNPTLAKTATNVMPDGSKKYLQIWAYQGAELMWGGWHYRRDWIVKYGTNPSTGAKFSGGYTGTDIKDTPDFWEDDVFFPSWYDESVKSWYLADVDPTWDGQVPVTIKDWEWMLGIFKTAIEQEGISGGYGMQMYYPGYYETGDLVTSFGGGGATWYLDAAKQNAYFGLTSSSFRCYLQWMSDMYKAGYVDRHFNENQDMFYQCDQTTVAQGKVGLWYGLSSQLGAQMDISGGKPNSAANGYTNGICVFGARQPINTSYGTAENQRKIPSVMYQTTQEMRSFIVTDKAADKDLEALFTMMDYMYSEEGAVLSCVGLSAEQYNEYKEVTGKTISIMEQFKDDGGTFWSKGENGIKLNTKVTNTEQQNALRGSRFMGYAPMSDILDNSDDNYTQTTKGTNEYTFFRWKGDISNSMLGQLSVEDGEKVAEIKTNVRNYAAQTVYKYIKVGSQGYMNISDDAIWNAWCARINAYKVSEYTQIIQNLLNQLNA